ncbi:MAG: hypothetical protein AAGL96_17140, partial [Pseudomonadota bacterium]
EAIALSADIPDITLVLSDINLGSGTLKGRLQHHAVTRVPLLWSDPRDRHAARTDTRAWTMDMPASIPLPARGWTHSGGCRAAAFWTRSHPVPRTTTRC